jgi:hypothetical protein
MSAELQYSVRYEVIGPIFDKATPSDRREIEFSRETGESKYTMTVDLSDILDNVLAEYEFDEIASLRSDIEMYNSAKDTEKALAAESDLAELYTAEQLANYDEFDGEYGRYAQYLGDKVLTDMSEYASELSDTSVFVESWL